MAAERRAELSRGKRLTDEQRKEISEARALGMSRKEIAEAYGIATDSVTEIVRNYRRKTEGEDENLAHRECIVAGNKRTGRLTSTSDPHRYEGTCVVAGKANSKTFTTDNAASATKLWESWCEGLRRNASKQHVVNEPVKKEAPVVQEKPKTMEVKPVDKNKSVYVIWTKGDNPRLFGAYESMESALTEVDRLNDVASFLMNDRVFEVEELKLRS